MDKTHYYIHVNKTVIKKFFHLYIPPLLASCLTCDSHSYLHDLLPTPRLLREVWRRVGL